VTWPAGIHPESAKKIVLMADYRDGQQKTRESPPQAKVTPRTGAVVASAADNDGSTAATINAVPPEANIPSDDTVLVEAFRCPITQELMREPVVTPSGHTYECYAIRKVVEERGFSPQTKRRLRRSDLVPNRALADAIDQTRRLSASTTNNLGADTSSAAPEKKPHDELMASPMATDQFKLHSTISPATSSTSTPQCIAQGPATSPHLRAQTRSVSGTFPSTSIPVPAPSTCSVPSAVVPECLVIMPPPIADRTRRLCRIYSAASTTSGTAALRQASPATPIRKRGRELRPHESAPKEPCSTSRGLEAYFSPRAKSCRPAVVAGHHEGETPS